MKRGDVVSVALQGDYGKPRPALVLQSDAFEKLGTILVAPLTSFSGVAASSSLIRIRLEPDAANGLRSSSVIMMDRLTVVARVKVGPKFGRVDPETLVAVSRALRSLLDL